MWIDHGSTKTRVVHHESTGKKTPFVIVHGWGGSSASWKAVSEQLAHAGHDVYAVDVPGFGKTAMDDPYTVDDYIAWLGKVIKALPCADRYCLLGHSNGGRMSIGYAVQKPHGIQKLFLCNAAGVKRKPSKKRTILNFFASTLRRTTSLPGVPLLRKLLYRLIGGHDYLALDSDFKKETFQYMIESNLEPVMPSIALPTHIIRGSDDTYTPLWQGDLMHSLIPGSTYDVFPGLKHGIHLKEPVLLAEKILSHCND